MAFDLSDLFDKRYPLNTVTFQQIYIQGAVVIFGNELEIMFKFTTERIESEVAVSLFNVFKARVAIAAGYGNPFANTGFTAKFTIETGFDQLSKKTSEVLVVALQAARKALEKAQVTVKEAKLACERKAGSFCNICEKLACDEITEECKHAMDKFKHYVGEKIDKFGKEFIRSISKFTSSWPVPGIQSVKSREVINGAIVKAGQKTKTKKNKKKTKKKTHDAIRPRPPLCCPSSDTFAPFTTALRFTF